MVETVSQTARSPDSQKSVLICLLRLDLRISDNPLFYYAHQTPRPIVNAVDKTVDLSKIQDEALLGSTADYLLPVYVFDEREMELSGLPGYMRKGPAAKTKEYGFWKTGGFRARFISETVYDLRSRLRDVGSDLLIRFGTPEDVIQNLVTAFQAQGTHVEGVWLQKEMTHAEVEVENLIVKNLQGTGVHTSFVQGKTLVHPVDLPFPSSETPDVFTPFRKKVESLGRKMVRPAMTSPSNFKPMPPRIPKTSDYSLDVSYEVDVDGLGSHKPETRDQQEDQVSFHDILKYLLEPLKDPHLPQSTDSNVRLQQRHSQSAFPLRGGESAALDRLDWYFVRGKSADSSRWGKADPPPVSRYKQTRNNLVGHAYSTKMSPFLAYGSISPRMIWEALDVHEQKFGEDQNTYWVRFELLWRDYFFFVAEKFGLLLYDIGGFEKATDPRQAAKKLEDGWWRKWDPKDDGPEHEMTRLLEGRTGIPFIDANILELLESGFMSNRGRQNVASFLSKDLGYDWRIGAEFFQSHLIDYDPTSNYGNWQYVAGCGNDPRASRQFNTIKQAKDYDSHGEYVKMWIPALRYLHPDYVHTPWLLTAEERKQYSLKTTKMEVSIDAYPESPVYEHEGWRRHYERKQGVGSKMHGNPQEKVKDGRVPRRHRPAPQRSQPVQHGSRFLDRERNDHYSAPALPQSRWSERIPRNGNPLLRDTSASEHEVQTDTGRSLASSNRENPSSSAPIKPAPYVSAANGSAMSASTVRAPGQAFSFGPGRTSSAHSGDGTSLLARTGNNVRSDVLGSTGNRSASNNTVPLSSASAVASQLSKADLETSWRRESK